MSKRQHIRATFCAYSVIAVGLAAALAAETAHAAAGGKWIVDETSNCGTSNPFFTPGERIRWQGACADGKLQGPGVLVWYQNNQETERNEGTFRSGEFHGDVVTTYPDGQKVYGQYVDGQRHGRFVIVRIDGQHMRANYTNGALQSQSPMAPADVAAWRRGPVQSAEAPVAPAPASQASERGRNKSAAAPAAAPAESPGWGKRMLGAVTGLLGFGDREPQPAPPPRPSKQVASNKGSASVPQAAPTPPPVSVPGPPAEMRAQASPPASVPAASARPPVTYGGPEPQPPAVPRMPVTVVVSEPFGGDMYDMGIFLKERHPFGNLPTAKSAIPVVSGASPAVASPWPPLPRRALDDPNLQVVVQPGHSTAQLANGWKGNPGVVEAAAATVVLPSSPPPSMGVDGLFTRAYQLERAGQLAEAEQAYEQLLMTYPSSPSAQLANSRLNDLRRARTDVATRESVQRIGAAAAVEEPEDDYEYGASGRVVAVNSPVPARVGTRANPHQSLNTDSPDLHRRVCTRPGTYESGAKWCGTVRRDEGQYFRVDVADVELPRFGTIGISRSVCTGNTFLNWFSRGSQVLVPKTCMAFQN